MTDLAGKARAFHDLHIAGRPLVLPNVWDAAGARIVERAGGAAVATSSAAVAWTLGAADGGGLDRDSALAAVARVAAAVELPVTADIEDGYAERPGDVEETIRRVLAAGAVGVNIEDATGAGPDPLRPVAEQAERITAARVAADAAGVPLYVNARVDTYLRAVGAPGDRLARTLERAAAYRAAGADGIFVPGVTDPATVAELASGIDVPLNVLAGPGAPPVAELAGSGAARVSVGSGIAEAAYALLRRAAREVLTDGTYTELTPALDYGELNALLS